MAEHVPDEASTYVPLTARIEAELQAEIDRFAKEDSRPGAPATRSQVVRVLLWDAVQRRRAASAAAQGV